MSLRSIWLIWHYAGYFAFAVNVLAFVLPCRIRRGAKLLWTAVLLVFALKPLLFCACGDGADVAECVPELPDSIIFVLETGYFGSLALAGLSLVWWTRRGRVWLLPTLAFGSALWGMVGGLALPSVREVELAFPNLPERLDGYRILQISDIHASPAARRWRTQAIVGRANAQRADLVCLTGDLADGRAEYAARFIEPSRGLKARDGVWAVTGNHEYLNQSAAWRDLYAAWGIRFLVNTCVFPQAGLALGGVNDRSARWRGTSVYGALPDVAEAFAAATNGEFRVLLEHDPLTAERNLREGGVDLQLSGHTHGFFFPGLARIMASHYGGYVRGLYRRGDAAVYVNPACGQWRGFPLRYFNPQELTLITLRRSRK